MADNKNIVAEIVLASLIVGGIVYFFTQCLPKQAAGIFVASDGYNNNNQDGGKSEMDVRIIEEHDCIIPNEMLDDFPDNEPNFASLTPADQITWDKLR